MNLRHKDARGLTALLHAIGWTGVLAGALSVVFNRNGLYFTADSWAAWEGSISLLQQGRYEFIGGHPQTFWLPFYPGFLALIQSVWGVSGRAMAIAQAILCLAAGISWAGFAIFIARDYTELSGRLHRECLLICLLIVALFLPNNLYIPIGNELALVFVPFVFMLSARFLLDEHHRHGAVVSIGCGAVLLAAILSHKSSFVFGLVAILAPMANRRSRVSSRIAQAGTIAIVAYPLWFYLEHRLQSINYAAVGTLVDAAQRGGILERWGTGMSSPFQTLMQALGATGEFFLPVQHAWLGIPITIVTAVLLLGAAFTWGNRYWRGGTPGNEHPTMRVRSLATVVHVFMGIVLLYVLHNIFQFHHPFKGRFFWSSALALTPVILFEIASRSRRWMWIVGLVLIAGLLGRSMKFTLKGIVAAPQSSAMSTTENVVYSNHTLLASSEASVGPGLVAVDPPDYPWTGRGGSR